MSEPTQSEPTQQQPRPPSFGRSMGALWLYTLLRFALFGALWALLWFFGVGGFLAAIIALALSVPLSYVLLARPRAALSDTIESRLAARQRRAEDLDARLNGEDAQPPES